MEEREKGYGRKKKSPLKNTIPTVTGTLCAINGLFQAFFLTGTSFITTRSISNIFSFFLKRLPCFVFLLQQSENKTEDCKTLFFRRLGGVLPCFGSNLSTKSFWPTSLHSNVFNGVTVYSMEK